MEYHSEREGEAVPREKQELDRRVHKGIEAAILGRVANGSFGATFPEYCIDGPVPIGTDEDLFRKSLQANVPATSRWPWEYGSDDVHSSWVLSSDIPSTRQVLETIEFCWRRIGKPIVVSYHDYGRHNHLRFDIQAGRDEFGEEIEDILRRNGIAYTLKEDGRIERLLPPEIDAAVTRSEFQTGDDELNRLLTTARTKFLHPDVERRREALEALWDAWERLKTTWPGSDKQAQAEAMLNEVAGVDSPTFREEMGKEATALNRIGNKLRIRHSETTQEILATSQHVDYLFQRMFSLIWMILHMQKKVGVEA